MTNENYETKIEHQQVNADSFTLKDISVKFQDLSGGLKTFVVLGWITIAITLMGFGIGLIQGFQMVM